MFHIYLQSPPPRAWRRQYFSEPHLPKGLYLFHQVDFVAKFALIRTVRSSFLPVKVPEILFRRSLYISQLKRIGATVCLLSPHSQQGQGTFGTPL